MAVLVSWVVSIFFAFGILVSADNDVIEVPCSTLEVPCDGGGCILKGTWCDSVPDCPDESDEKYCASRGNPEPKCLDHHFRCNEGSCIPIGARCDNYPDCRDASDEAKVICGSSTSSSNSAKRKRNSQYDPIHAVEAVKKAVYWIMERRSIDYSWGDDTARAVVALYLSGYKRYAVKEGDLIKKQLRIEIAMDIVKNKTQMMSLSKLANYVNALLATCQNPGSFEGLNLTRMLRIGTDSQMRSNGTVAPLVFLTLCLTEEFRRDYFDHLYNCFLRLQSQQKMDLQAVALMAVSCLEKQKSFRINEKSSDEKVTDRLARSLASNYERKGKEADVYTTALVIQALNAAGYESWDKRSALTRLVKQQHHDGNFGGLLATYYALPAIAEKSLLSLKHTACSNLRPYDSSLLPSTDEQKDIQYSLWFGAPVTASHTISLKVGANWTVFETMKYAADLNGLFSFHYEETRSGPSVYSIANVPNDIERKFQWTLYRKSKHAASQAFTGVNLLSFDLGGKPDSGDSVIMWYKSSSPSNAQ